MGVFFLKDRLRRKSLYMMYARQIKMAESAAMRLDCASAMKFRRSMDNLWSGECCERDIIESAILVARGKQSDYQKALVLIRKLQVSLAAYIRNTSSIEPGRIRYAVSILIKALYLKANCLYYCEKDRDSLAAFEKCKSLLACNPSIEQSNSRIVTDIRRKIVSLSFVLSVDGLRKAEKLLSEGKCEAVCKMIDAVVSRCGLKYMDHRVLTVGAIAHLIKGDYKKGRMLIEEDYTFSPDCIETQFVFAISHLGCKRKHLRKRALSLIMKIASNKVKSSCRTSAKKARRIFMVAVRVLERRASLAGHELVHSENIIIRKSHIEECLRFVYTDGSVSDARGNAHTMSWTA